MILAYNIIMSIKFLICCIWLFDLIFATKLGKIIITSSGLVQGSLLQYKEISYYSYQGIPYAENPTGKLRLQPPVARQPWKEVFNATKQPPVCPQVEDKYTRNDMSEDCLRLNIYVPAIDKEQLLPVLVYAHGGGFHYISGNKDLLYGPQLLLRQNIIFVSINFRLGALGFMSLGIDEASGNAGLKDFLLGLKWIQINIENFGGDKNNVTLGGNSSGASLVNFLTLTNKSNDLFHRVILQSGSAFSYRAFSKHPIENTMAVVKRLCPQTETKYLILKCIREADAFHIIDIQTEIENDDNSVVRPSTPFLPSIEIEVPHAVITKDPREILKSNEMKAVPILAGFNGEEGIYMTKFSLNQPDYVLKTLRKNIELIIPSNIEYPFGSKKSLDLAKKIVSFYFGNEYFSNWTLNNAYDYMGDIHYVFPLNAFINTYRTRKDSKDIYFYVFDFDGELNWYKLFYRISFPGTSHADDLGYIFITDVTKEKLKKANNRSLRMVKVLTTLWSNFVKYGNPTPQEIFGITWPIHNVQQEMVLLNDNPSIIKMYTSHEKRLQFWYNVYNEYYTYVANGGKLEFKNIV